MTTPVLRWLDRADRAAMPLAIVIALLLIAQWPLPDLAAAGNGPTQANDLAQWLFALYLAVAMRHAGRRARPGRIAAALCVLPWALFLAVTAATPVACSVLGLEPFPDTFDPGYFLIDGALVLLAALLAVQSALDLWQALRPPAPTETPEEPGPFNP